MSDKVVDGVVKGANLAVIVYALLELEPFASIVSLKTASEKLLPEIVGKP